MRTRAYLEHIRQAIERIERYLDGFDRQAFMGQEEKQDAVIRNLEIIGEAAQNIRRHHPQFAAAHPRFPWVGAYGMRNALAHGYFRVDLEIVWRTVCDDLPSMRAAVDVLLRESPDEPDQGV